MSAADLLVMYTYAGDANLDGKIDIDDYGQIDSNVSKSDTVFGWFNGDFNYDGAISIELEYSPQPDKIAEWVTEAYSATDNLMKQAGIKRG